VNAAAVLLPDVDQSWVRRIGIDEHRHRPSCPSTARWRPLIILRGAHLRIC
jgi:hypothetical protein